MTRTADGFTVEGHELGWRVTRIRRTITSPWLGAGGCLRLMVELDEGDGFHYLVVRGFGAEHSL
ncbi:MAG: hypothetical protein V9E85_13790 [Candidatus Nanopelagicales bacterium]